MFLSQGKVSVLENLLQIKVFQCKLLPPAEVSFEGDPPPIELFWGQFNRKELRNCVLKSFAKSKEGESDWRVAIGRVELVGLDGGRSIHRISLTLSGALNVS